MEPGELRPDSKVDGIESLAYKYPDGLFMFCSRLFNREGSMFGRVLGRNLVSHLHPLLDVMEEIGLDRLHLRGSTVADIAMRFTGAWKNMSRTALKENVKRDRNFIGEMSRMNGWPFRIGEAFIQGSDIDWLIDEGDMPGFSGKLVRRVEQLGETTKVEREEHKRHIVELEVVKDEVWFNPLGEDIGGAIKSGKSYYRITYGEWFNGVPYCEWVWGIKDSGLSTETNDIISIGFVPSDAFLPDNAKGHNTRTRPEVNSWDRLTAGIANELPPEILKQLLPLMSADAPEIPYAKAIGIGVAIPPEYMRPFEAQKGFIIKRPSSKKEETYPEPFIFISPKDLEIMSHSIRLETYYLSLQESQMIAEHTLSPEIEGKIQLQFLEVLRSVRKALRYSETPATTMVRIWREAEARTHFVEGVEQLLGKVPADADPSEWEMEAMRELLTMVFYAPRELAEAALMIGEEGGWARLFPNWNLIKPVLQQCKSRKRIAIESVSSWPIDGWHVLMRNGVTHYEQLFSLCRLGLLHDRNGVVGEAKG